MSLTYSFLTCQAPQCRGTLGALGLHMLAVHGFCGGRGSRLRPDPATAAWRIPLAP